MHRFIGIVVVIITVGICVLCIALINRDDLPPNDDKTFNNFCGTNAYTTETASEEKNYLMPIALLVTS
nr:hypothetical protein [uncultured Psychroserpens sp.]